MNREDWEHFILQLKDLEGRILETSIELDGSDRVLVYNAELDALNKVIDYMDTAIKTMK